MEAVIDVPAVLCDTNVFIHAFNGNEDTIRLLSEIGHDNIVVSSITVMELYLGMGNKRELAQMKQKIGYYDIIEVNERISGLAQNLIEKYNLSHNLTIPDAIIGATSLISGIPLFTYNIKDFQFIPDIQLYPFE